MSRTPASSPRRTLAGKIDVMCGRGNGKTSCFLTRVFRRSMLSSSSTRKVIFFKVNTCKMQINTCACACAYTYTCGRACVLLKSLALEPAHPLSPITFDDQRSINRATLRLRPRLSLRYIHRRCDHTCEGIRAVERRQQAQVEFGRGLALVWGLGFGVWGLGLGPITCRTPPPLGLVTKRRS